MMPKNKKPLLKKQYRELPELRRRIEEDSCIRPEDPESRIALWEYIRSTLAKEYEKRNTPPCERGSISDKTLERLWGIEKDERKHYFSTYDTLAMVAGYENWQDFVQSLPKEEKRVKVFFPDEVESSRLKEGEKVLIGWYGIYYIKATYLGNDRYEVRQSKGTKYKKGDIFRAKWFSVTYVRTCGKNGEGYLYAPRVWIRLDEKLQGKSEVEEAYYYDLDIDVD